MLVFPLLSISISLSLSPAQVCRSCSNPGTLPQSLLHRHSGYLRQRYGGTLQHIPLWPWLSVLRQEMFEWAVNESSWAVLSSLSIYIYIRVLVLVCVLTGLDADLLTVLPALSRHPSLKHLYLGKNFNIKNRCCRFSLSRFTAAMYLCLCVCVARVCVCMDTRVHALHMPAWIYASVILLPSS